MINDCGQRGQLDRLGGDKHSRSQKHNKKLPLDGSLTIQNAFIWMRTLNVLISHKGFL